MIIWSIVIIINFVLTLKVSTASLPQDREPCEIKVVFNHTCSFHTWVCAGSCRERVRLSGFRRQGISSTPEAVDMNGRFQMQGGKNWILPKYVKANGFFWDSHWLEIWSNHFCPSMGLNGGSVAIDSGGFLKCPIPVRVSAEHRQSGKFLVNPKTYRLKQNVLNWYKFFFA